MTLQSIAKKYGIKGYATSVTAPPISKEFAISVINKLFMKPKKPKKPKPKY